MSYLSSPPQNVGLLNRLLGQQHGMLPQQAVVDPAATQPGGFMSGVNSFVADNPNMMLGAGLALLDHRQNATVPFSDAFRMGMVGRQADAQRQEVRQAKQNQNATARFLVKKGIAKDEEEAMGIMASGAGQQVVAQALKPGGFNSAEYGLSVVYGQDADGNVVPYQINNQGGAPKRVEFGDGVTAAPGVTMRNLGTTEGAFSKVTGLPVARTEKDLASAAAQKELGTESGKAAGGLPNLEFAAENVNKEIDGILADPSLKAGTGLSSWTTALPGTPMYGFGKRVKQLTGQTFLQAYQMLRGGGAITEMEGQKATEAIARLDNAQSQEDFTSALEELRGIIARGLEVARQKARMAGPITPAADAASAPAPAGNLAPMPNGELMWTPGQ